MTSAEKINYYLKLNGEDAADLSAAINVSPSAVSQWLNGKTAPSNRSLKKTADHFHIDVADLLDDDMETPAAITGDGLSYSEKALMVARAYDKGGDDLKDFLERAIAMYEKTAPKD